MMLYRIRSKKLGLFSLGGCTIDEYRSFNKSGKIWKRRADVMLHLNQMSPAAREKYKELECEIDEYDMVATGACRPVAPIFDEIEREIEDDKRAAVKSLIKQHGSA